MPKEKVPKRLLTDEMKEWQGEFKSCRKIAKATNLGGYEFKEVLKSALFKMQNLLQNIPRVKVKELAQQPEEGE